MISTPVTRKCTFRNTSFKHPSSVHDIVVFRLRLSSSIFRRVALLCCLPRPVGLVILHHGECKNLFDAIIVGQEHIQTVNSHAPATSRWQTIFQSLAEVLVDHLSLVIALSFLVRLFLESQSLVKRLQTL